ncbi:hypothetical protein [Methylobacterium sp. NFXW15]|uniref:hypothetical protein n=1 Tax=Methylobacterium sp. NFXW15 TaxID=2819512 RepID=UPI003CF423C2
MFATRRENRIESMLKSDICPPRDGPNADPILYGVATALAQLFPPVTSSEPRQGAERLSAKPCAKPPAKNGAPR